MEREGEGLMEGRGRDSLGGSGGPRCRVFVVVRRVVLVAYPRCRVLVVGLSSRARVVVPSFPVLVVMWLSWCQVLASWEGRASLADGGGSRFCACGHPFVRVLGRSSSFGQSSLFVGGRVRWWAVGFVIWAVGGFH